MNIKRKLDFSFLLYEVLIFFSNEDKIIKNIQQNINIDNDNFLKRNINAPEKIKFRTRYISLISNFI